MYSLDFIFISEFYRESIHFRLSQLHRLESSIINTLSIIAFSLIVDLWKCLQGIQLVFNLSLSPLESRSDHSHGHETLTKCEKLQEKGNMLGI